jgi:hypothetical protein
MVDAVLELADASSELLDLLAYRVATHDFLDLLHPEKRRSRSLGDFSSRAGSPRADWRGQALVEMTGEAEE